MNDKEPRQVIIVDDFGARGVSPLELAAFISRMDAGERAALEALHQPDIPPVPRLADFEAKLAAAAEPYASPEPRSPWDRGSKGSKVKESLSDMMARLQVPRKETWKAPTITEDFICTNCDGAPDGGHADDAWCLRTLEDDQP